MPFCCSEPGIVGERWRQNGLQGLSQELLFLNVPRLGIPLSFVIGSDLGTGSHVFWAGLKQYTAESGPLASHWDYRHVSSCPEYMLQRLELLASYILDN